MPDPRPKVLVTTRLFDAAAARFLEARGFAVVPSGLPPEALDTDIPDATLAALLQGVGGWIVGMRAVTRDLLAAHPGLKVIARRGVGYDRVDAAAARALGRVVAITAGANDASVADHTLALMLAVLRRLKENNAALAAGDWRVAAGADLTGKTVGLIGFGRTARGVARRLSGFEARVLVAAPRFEGPAPGVTHVPLARLLAESDVVSVHAPLTEQTRHLIDAAALAAMKPGAILVNTARGGLVDDTALHAAVLSGHIAGAGLDVFEAEEDAALRPLAQALAALPQVVASAHAAGSSREALARGNMIAAQCVAAVLAGEAAPEGCIVADGRAPA
ncbi:phosphoglycerate dehydrogenase [Xanthobacter sp. KR7-225]|uniref:phosphoglycerate dehydrogenase n=1 Tax=Xanthobacter sp. KR7-225 TaxID=3156613 RepID=UPI0032B462F3